VVKFPLKKFLKNYFPKIPEKATKKTYKIKHKKPLSNLQSNYSSSLINEAFLGILWVNDYNGILTKIQRNKI